MTDCLDCGKPWGVVLERGELPSPEAQRLAQQEMEDLLKEHVEFAYPFEVVAVEVVFLNRSLCDFASDRFGACVPEGPCWVELTGCDIPQWLIKNRPHRWAYRWDCCNLDLFGSGALKEMAAQ